ncbi:MAG TPA: DNA oxidative demethylase AlkB [Stellaceae bacterium]|jgi:alkylated DNA repair protein (DNA oxidative demethylase)|nr:DNA oxidative demethylase AlkB [Stellaceae bacterium]
MSRHADNATTELFPAEPIETIVPGALWLHGFARDDAEALLRTIAKIAAVSPFRNMVTPGGFTMSVAMTNCGRAGWVTDRRGYRYAELDPLSEQPWPAMPPLFGAIAARAAAAAGFADFAPDACLVNRYEPGARMSLHQDKDERDFTQPIVSVSLGLPATFLFGGEKRSDRPKRLRLENGDVVVWGGPARKVFHGVDPLRQGIDPLTGACRYNLTLRRAF